LPTVGEAARLTLAAVGGETDAGLVLVAGWVNARYRRLCAKGYFKHLRRVGEVEIPANINAGTVAVTQGSKTVTGDATAKAAWTAAMQEGWALRAANVWHEIDHVDLVAGTLGLKMPYAEATSATASYHAVQRWTKLDAAARWLGTFLHMRRRHPVDLWSSALLDQAAPDRSRVGDGPWVVVEHTPAADGAKRVEFYPYSDGLELIHYVFWSLPEALEIDDLIPQEIDQDVLVEGALIDVYRHAAAQAARKGSIEQAAYWRNEYRDQARKWEDDVALALRTARGVDDATMILTGFRRATATTRDIRNAQDYVLDRWPL